MKKKNLNSVDILLKVFKMLFPHIIIASITGVLRYIIINYDSFKDGEKLAACIIMEELILLLITYIRRLVGKLPEIFSIIMIDIFSLFIISILSLLF